MGVGVLVSNLESIEVTGPVRTQERTGMLEKWLTHVGGWDGLVWECVVGW